MQKIRMKVNIILINKRESIGLKYFNDTKAFIEYSNDMQNVYKDIDEYNIDKERKIFVVFDDMIVDMINKKKLDSIVTELFIRGRKLNISFAFMTQSYLKLPKNLILNTIHCFITKIPKKRELQPIAMNHSSDISNKGFINIYRECTAKPHAFLVNDTTLVSDNPLRFKKSF